MEKADEKTALRVRKRPVKRYSEAGRRGLLARARTLWAQGASMAAVAAELDVSKHTLSYWRSVEGISGKRKIQRVHVVAAEPVSRTISATGPCGLRFELTLDEAAALLHPFGQTRPDTRPNGFYVAGPMAAASSSWRSKHQAAAA